MSTGLDGSWLLSIWLTSKVKKKKKKGTAGISPACLRWTFSNRIFSQDPARDCKHQQSLQSKLNHVLDLHLWFACPGDESWLLDDKPS
jgi:hypothetical protein